jgi:1-acyl-sn-glycerol-3-phosphate acyltransferase
MHLHLLRRIVYWLIVWPLTVIVLGIWVQDRARIPTEGPAIIVANHNSHLDTLVIMALCPPSVRWRLRPVGAADYFLANRMLAWIAVDLFRMIPLDRNGGNPRQLFEPISEALNRGEVILLFPEGTRGEPEKLSELKRGIAHIASRHPEVPVVPIYLHGLGKALPRGDAFLVPFCCDALVGEPFRWEGSRVRFMETLNESFRTLAEMIPRGTHPW